MSKDEKQKAYRPLECLQNIKNSQALYYLNSKNPYLHDEGKKIGWRDGVRAIICIFKYNLFSGKQQ